MEKVNSSQHQPSNVSQPNIEAEYCTLPGFENQRFELIGMGAFGKVYRGVNQVTGEKFALKVIDFSENSKHGIPPEILREISALKDLEGYNHPNFVKLIGIIPQFGKIYLMFEYCYEDLLDCMQAQKKLETKVF